MTTHPAPPADFSGLVEAWAQTVQSVADLGRTIRPEQALLPTDCPGWNVQDQISHVVSIEALFAGAPDPDVDVSHHQHVRHESAARLERHVEVRRSRTLADIVEELDWRLAELLSAYQSPSVDPDEERIGPFGPTTLADFIRLRIFDVWTHEQDIREALGRIGGLDTPAAAVSMNLFFDAFPRIVAREARISPGHAVIVDLTGPTTGRVGARVHEENGRPRGEPLFTGHATETPDLTTTTLAMSTQVAGRLIAGRRRPSEVAVDVHGDDEVARHVLASLTLTP